MVALDLDDLLGDLFDLVPGAEADGVGDAGIGLDLVVCHPEAPSDGHVEAGQPALVVGDGNEAESVGEDVDLIGGRDGDGDVGERDLEDDDERQQKQEQQPQIGHAEQRQSADAKYAAALQRRNIPPTRHRLAGQFADPERFLICHSPRPPGEKRPAPS